MHFYFFLIIPPWKGSCGLSFEQTWHPFTYLYWLNSSAEENVKSLQIYDGNNCKLPCRLRWAKMSFNKKVTFFSILFVWPGCHSLNLSNSVKSVICRHHFKPNNRLIFLKVFFFFIDSQITGKHSSLLFPLKVNDTFTKTV